MNNHITRVAIAEDQSLFRECLGSQLNNCPELNVVCEAKNGKDLLEKLKKIEAPDIVLMDLNMPEMNGMETTRKLKEKHPKIRIVILSVYSEPQYVAAMVQEGVCGYLPKSTLLSDVRIAINQVKTNGFHFGPEMLQAMKTGMMYKKQKHIALEKLEMLTIREKEILRMICMEQSTSEIADKLFISKRTVEWHRNNLLLKTESKNTAGLVIYAMRHNFLDIDPHISTGHD